MKVIDFTDCDVGLLVTHSPHYKKEHGIHSRKKDIGIIVGKSWELLCDGKGGCCFPIIHWEGEVIAHLCHPANVVPYRKHNLPLKEVE